MFTEFGECVRDREVLKAGFCESAERLDCLAVAQQASASAAASRVLLSFSPWTSCGKASFAFEAPSARATSHHSTVPRGCVSSRNRQTFPSGYRTPPAA